MVNVVLKKMTGRWLDRNWLQRGAAPLPRVSYTEVVEILGKDFSHNISRDEEQLLIQKFDDHPLLITRCPKKMKFINMIEDENTPKLEDSACTKSVDPNQAAVLPFR